MAELASRERLEKILASMLVANPDDMSYAAATLADQEKYSPEHIRDAILYIDLEVCKAHQRTIGDGYRQQYGAMTVVANGEIAAHPGKLGVVEIQKVNGGLWQRGIKAQSIDQINKYLTNVDGRYGSAANYAGRYVIDEEMRLYFTGYACRVFTPTDLVITGECQAPAVDEPTIARGAYAMLIKDGVDAGTFAKASDEYMKDIDRIHSMGGPAPPLDMYVAAGG